MTTPSLIYRLAARAAFSILDVQRFQLRTVGLEHVPTTGGVVLAVNHTSYWDFFAAGRGPYEQLGRPPRILAKESLFRVPVFGSMMRSAEHVPVTRGAGRDAFEVAVERLEAGELILVLPEQTISPTLDLLPFKTGAVRMAARARVPVIPCAVWGIHRFHTVDRRLRWSWRLPVEVHYGPPLAFDPDVDAAEGTGRLRTAVQEVLDDAIAAYPEAPPEGAWWMPARLGGGAPPSFEVPDF
ncbi:MAG: lysophospholipid acyltransferase family protein [Nitriliruptorales bacterium]|nr:lysophospholipid acyltransferase family protein [Nitriliruptorales bacterium]